MNKLRQNTRVCDYEMFRKESKQEPVAKAIALGGVETGEQKEREQAIVAGQRGLA